MNRTYIQEAERDIKRTEANFTTHFSQVRQRLIKQAEKIAKQEKLAEMKTLISEIVDLIFKDMEGFFFDHETQQKIAEKLPITAQDLDNEFNQSVLLNY